ncbi:mycothione reductase [Nocardioides panacisoli]|uniref:mycothione reductase n=1 Tax=Nocardioides panacisoli TaxID=627624 RepID=UPI001C624C31|nr:mycothione reductase [Nocardioides panacisoli]QYJ02453.1 mycothione reductase [Nocardioides panacisoli]
MTHYDLVIIGTGSANSILDERFADWRVAIVEEGVFGGTCLNVGCIPTKMFVHPADLAHAASYAGPRLGVDSELAGVRWPEIRDRVFGRIDPIAEGGRRYRREHPDNAHVTVYDGHGSFVGDKTLEVATEGGTETLTADRFVLGAGSRAVAPPVPGLADVGHHTSDTIMRLEELPARMLILGSGFIAAEFAHVFSAFGVEVVQIARSGALLRSHDGDISRRHTEVASARHEVRLHRDTVAARRTEAGIELDLAHEGGTETVTGDVLLVATGRVPNADLLRPEATGVATVGDRIDVDEFQRTSVEGILALGDVSSPHQLKHVANHEARVVQHNLLHPDDPVASDHRFVPHAVFTHPQIASVGLTEEEATEQGLRHVTAIHDYGDIAYGWAMEDTTGFVKLVADPATGLLLGAHIIGPQAPTLLQPVIQAMSFGLDVARMARGQYWIHPAMTEVLENALLKLDLD